MRIEILSEARNEYWAFLRYYRHGVGKPYAEKFAHKIKAAVSQLATFPETGLLRKETPLGQQGFRVLFIDQYACIYRIENDSVLIYHLADARKNYIYHIFGIE